MSKQIKYLLAVALLCLPLCVGAQSEDSFGGWFEVGLSKKLNKRVSLNLGAEMRTGEKARGAFSVGASYAPLKFLKFSAGYNFIDKYKASAWEDNFQKDLSDLDQGNGFDFRPAYWRITHRAYADATGSINLLNLLRISVRERYQFSHNSYKEYDVTEWRYANETYIDPENGPCDAYVLQDGYPQNITKVKEATDDHVLRSRVKVEFSKKGLFFTPFLSAEAHNSLSSDMKLEKMRYSAGVEFKCLKWLRVSAAYLLTKEYCDDMSPKLDPRNKKIHALNVGCYFDF